MAHRTIFPSPPLLQRKGKNEIKEKKTSTSNNDASCKVVFTAMPVHIKIQFDLGDYEAYEEYDNNSNNDSKASDTPPPTPQTPRSKLASQRSWRRALLRKVSSAPPSQSSAGFEPPAPAGSASNLSLARWDWKTIFYHWSFPLDEVIVGIRRVSVSLKVWRSSSMCFLFVHAAISLSSSIATPAPSMTT